MNGLSAIANQTSENTAVNANALANKGGQNQLEIANLSIIREVILLSNQLIENKSAREFCPSS